MGKATITGNDGEGLYTVTVEKDFAQLNAQITVLDARISGIMESISGTQAQIEIELDTLPADPSADPTPDPSPDPDPDNPPPDGLPAGDGSQGGTVK